MQHSVLVIGVGSIGERHTRCFQNTGRARVSIAEINPTLRETVAARYAVPHFPSLEAALQTPPEVAVVCTPAPFHIPMTRSLVAAGVHVLIEKPLGTNEAGLRELLDEWQQRPVTLGVAYVYRAFPELQAARELLQSGEFGNPLQVTVVGGQHFPTYRPAYRDIYYARHETGGGAIQDAITHLLNLGEWLVGPIRRLVCDAAHQSLPGVEVEDTVHLLARHQSPGSTQPTILGSYSINQYQAPNEIVIQVVCERGTVRCEIHRQRLMTMTQPGAEWTCREFGPRERDDVYLRQAHQFLDAVEQRQTPACSLAEGWQTLRCNLAALRSSETAAWQSIEPVSVS